MSTPTAEQKVLPVADSSSYAQMRAPEEQPYQDTTVDVKVVLAALWTAVLFVFAYVDIFSFLREDVLRGALDGKVVNPAIDVNQAFLTATLIYVLVPASMVVLSLLLKPRVSRIGNIVISGVYIVSVVVSCIGETWAYYLLGSAVETLLLAVIARTAWKWPRPSTLTSTVSHE